MECIIENTKYRDGRGIPDYFNVSNGISTMTNYVGTFPIATSEHLLSEKKKKKTTYWVVKPLNLVFLRL